MRTVRINVRAKGSGPIFIGRRGEKEATQIVFDVSQLIATYGDGTCVLLAKRPKDTAAYPVTVVREGNTVVWTVTDTDTVYQGSGELELFWYVGDALAKTNVWTSVIGRDIGESTDTPPDPYDDWMAALTGLAAETQRNSEDAGVSKDAAAQYASDASASAQTAATEAAKITGLSATAETLPSESEATARYEDGVLLLGIPQGSRGAAGVGVPDGGGTEQVLAKTSDSDYDTEWRTITQGLAPLLGDTSSVTPAQVRTAVLEGRSVCVQAESAIEGIPLVLAFTAFNAATDIFGGQGINVVVSNTIVQYGSAPLLFTLIGDVKESMWNDVSISVLAVG